MLGPSHGIDNRGCLFHVAVLTDRGECLPGTKRFIFGNPGDALHHLRCVPGILLLQELENATRMLQREIVSYIRWQRRRRNRAPAHAFRAVRTLGLVSLTFRLARSPRSLRMFGRSTRMRGRA